MCGRYDNLIAREAYRRIFNAERLPASNFPPRYNIAPTDPIPIIRVDPRDGQRELVMERWGLVPWFAKSIPKIPYINSRAETVAAASDPGCPEKSPRASSRRLGSQFSERGGATRQHDSELGENTELGVDFDRAGVLLDDDVVAQR